MTGHENPSYSTVQEHASVVTFGVQTEADGTTSLYDTVRDQVNSPASREPETSVYSTIQKHGSAAEADVAAMEKVADKTTSVYEVATEPESHCRLKGRVRASTPDKAVADTIYSTLQAVCPVDDGSV